MQFNLYSKHAKEFSDSRQSPWLGWEKLLPIVQKLSPLTILDLGCGNGRFLKWGVRKQLAVHNYLGVDNSEELLKIAKEGTRIQESRTEDKPSQSDKESILPSIDFRKVDLEKRHWCEKVDDRRYNLVVGFGLMHHLKTFEARRNILKYSQDLLTKDGCLVLAFWQFAKLNRYKNKLSAVNNDLLPVLTNDYIMTFGQSGATRFCHFCDDTEIIRLENSVNLKRINSFYSDGREDNENLYLVWQKKAD